jgi:hypothetical protein
MNSVSSAPVRRRHIRCKMMHVRQDHPGRRPFRESLNVRDGCVHNYPPRWNATPGRCWSPAAIARPAKCHSTAALGVHPVIGAPIRGAAASRSMPSVRLRASTRRSATPGLPCEGEPPIVTNIARTNSSGSFSRLGRSRTVGWSVLLPRVHTRPLAWSADPRNRLASACFPQP